MASRALYLFAIRDGEINEAIDDQLALATKVWADSGLGDRALTAVTTGPLSTRRDIEAIAHELRDMTSEDIAVIYITGHGVRSGSGRHYLRLPDTPRGHHLARGYPTADLVTAALASQARQVLVIVNSCFVGELQAELSSLYKDLPVERRQALLAVLTTADFDEMPRASELTVLLKETHRFLTERAGYTEPLLSISEFVRELDDARRRLAKTGTSTLQIRRVLEAGDQYGPSLCLPNPGYQPPLPAIVGQSRRQLATPTRELDYWLDRASGRNSATDPGWYFTGRRELTAQLARFLTDGTGMLVITGAAGTGKSAIIARAVTLSDPNFLATPHYAQATAAADPDTVPPPGSVDLAVLARNKTTEELTEELLGAAGIAPIHTTETAARKVALRRQLVELFDPDRVTTIVIDGLDEAVKPAHTITDLIGPLLNHRGVRLVVGVRSSAPGQPNATTEADLLDLLRRFPSSLTPLRTDGAETVHDITDYLLALLPENDTLASRIATVVSPSFLDARFATHRLQGDQPPTEAELLASLQHGTIGLLRDDLAATATHEYPAPVLLAVLRASALAFGAGVPWADIWPAVASAVLDDTVLDHVVQHLMHTRLSGYLTHDTSGNRIVYRPVHEALADVLRDHPERLAEIPNETVTTVHRRIAESLNALLPDSAEVQPHPYLRRHLVDHATAGDTLNDTTVPATLLPWETSARIRSGLGLPITPTPETSVLATWSAIEPFLQDASPADRALSLDFARTGAGQPTTTVHPAGIRPRWAHWPLPNNILCNATSPIDALCVLAMQNGTLLATGGADRTVRLWDPMTGQQIGEPLVGHTAPVWAVSAVPLPDGHTLLATGGADRTVRLWDPVTGQQIGEPLIGHTGWVEAIAALALLDGGTLLVTGSEDRTVRLWDPTTGQQIGDPLTGHISRVSAVTAVPLPDGRTLVASGSHDKTVRLWDPVSGQAVGHPLTGHNGRVEAVAAVSVSDGRTLLASSGADRMVRLWDPVGGQAVGHPLTGHNGRVEAVAAVSVSDGRTLLATSSTDRTVRLWDPSTGQKVGDAFSGHTDHVMAVAAVSMPDGRTLVASGSHDQTVRLWDPNNSQRVDDPLTCHYRRVDAVAAVPLSDDRTLLATGGADATVWLWDPATGQPIGRPLVGHQGRVKAITTMPLSDGRTGLVTSGVDKTVRLWDPHTGKPIGHPFTGNQIDSFLWEYSDWGNAVPRVPFLDIGFVFATDVPNRTTRSWYPPANMGKAAKVRAAATVPLPDGGILIAVSDNDSDTVWLRVLDDYHGIYPLIGHTGLVKAISAVPLPGGRFLLATGGDDQTVRLWDPLTSRPVGDPLVGHTSSVTAVAAVAVSESRTLLATGSTDTTVRLWDPTTGQALASLSTTQPVRSLCALSGNASTHASLAIAGSEGIAVIECCDI